MAERINYLLGYGERLMEPITGPKKPGKKEHPYSFDEARSHVSSMAIQTVKALDELPPSACPFDETVALVTLHPTYIAKSHYPVELFQTVGVRPIGSRQREVAPKKWEKEGKVKKEKRKKRSERAMTAEIFVAGPRERFRNWASSLGLWTEESQGAKDLIKVEDFRPPDHRIRSILSENDAPLLEVVLHASGLPDSFYIIDGFREYMRLLDIKINLDKRIHAGGLCFLPVRIPLDTLDAVEKFSFLRVAREMPRLRQFRPILKNINGYRRFPCTLPKTGSLDASIRVAVFDGGLPANTDLSRWVNEITPPSVKSPVVECQEHGLAVTSALLFGPLEQGKNLETPYASIDHYRVLDTDTVSDPDDEYYDVLRRIQSVLDQKDYDFINLSIGPESPIEDDDVHAWTAILDSYFSTGKVLAAIAVGNNGEGDKVLGLSRIQTPSDCVNALSIGACDSYKGGWRRATYSSIGPGRSPGKVKPDALAFGGTGTNPYFVLDVSRPNYSYPTMGTSFATPTGLRTAIGVRAYLGPVISPLALKALLLHRCETLGDHDQIEGGWGRIPISVDDMITCGDGVVHVVYQHVIDPAQWVRARIPLPSGPMNGKIYIGATICFATYTDPHEPFNYTRSGLDVIFRPHSQRRKKTKQTYADAQPFFRGEQSYMTEREMRSGYKWETTMSEYHNYMPTSLHEPVFDIHYNARSAGRPTADAKQIRFALIVTVNALGMPDLYDKVLHKYRSQLEVLRPVMRIPVRT